ncbi:MAG: dTDP-4-dehydrorhamnose reductase [Spirochaetes bacterium]|nr:MAG: dTDP-4-dehydrorhamnose reductase [Spirochaetota bacterium]
MIWLTGNKGMLGHEVADALVSSAIPFIGTDREVDITDYVAVADFTEYHQPDIIINCAAYTAVDKAEDERDKAFSLNGIGPKNLAAISAILNARLTHISTDYVFNGKSRLPLDEDAPTDPVSIYGQSKNDGENAIRKSGCRYDIIRTAWLYGQYGPNFVSTMLRLMNKNDSLRVVDDQMGSPTRAGDLARFIVFITGQPLRDSGIFHFSNEGETTWYGFAQAIYQNARKRGLINHDVDIQPCPSSEYPTRAVRPSYSLLSKRKISEIFKWKVPGWETSLSEYLDKAGVEK